MQILFFLLRPYCQLTSVANITFTILWIKGNSNIESTGADPGFLDRGIHMYKSVLGSLC